MKRTLLFSIFISLFSSFFGYSAERNISIFCDHIEDVARQKNISFAEAATLIHNLGYRGVDVRVTMDDNKMRILDSIGFIPSSAIAEIDFSKGEKAEECRQAIDFMHRHHIKNCLLVPGFIPTDADKTLTDSIWLRSSSFAYMARRDGMNMMIEDYDSENSPCFNVEALDSFFKAVPDLGHVYDSGNYFYCEDDPVAALKHFRRRVRHVHLKDRVKIHDKASPALGTGILPLDDILAILLSTGYKGWLTVEHFGAEDMLKYAEISIKNLNEVWDRIEQN